MVNTYNDLRDVNLANTLAGEQQAENLIRTENQANYTVVTSAAPLVVTSIAGKRLKGLICIVANTGGVDIYDNTSATGTLLYSTGGLTLGQIVILPAAVIATVGITVDITTNGVVNIIWE